MPATGSYGVFQARVVDLAARDTANAAFALQADSPTRHFVAFVVRGFERAGAPQAALPSLAAALHSRPRRQLVQAWWDFDPGSGLGPALARLGGRVLGRRGYDALAAVLADPARRRLLQDKGRITEAELRLLAANDPKVVEEAGLACIAAFGPEVLDWIGAGLARRVPGATAEQVVSILRAKKGEEREEALLRFLGDAKLPVPWAGTAEVQPLRRASAMRAAGRRWRNCLGDAASLWPALRGDTAHYVCHPGPVIVRLRRDRVARSWFLEEALGPGNKTPRRAHMDAAVAAFRTADIPRLDANRMPWPTAAFDW